jgi:hypothetical protein
MYCSTVKVLEVQTMKIYSNKQILQLEEELKVLRCSLFCCSCPDEQKVLTMKVLLMVRYIENLESS